MSRLTQILRGKKIKPLTEMESAVKYAIDNAGSGGGSSLPAVTSADNGDLLGVVEGAWGKVDPPTGGETFTVTLTNENDTWTANKTIAEILTAHEAGKNCVAVGPYGEDEMGLSFSAPLALASSTMNVVQFVGLPDSGTIIIASGANAETDKWEVNPVELPKLPDVTASDNGSLLGVSGGAWAKVASTAPMLVTGTADGTSVTITTALADIKAAFDAGRTVYLSSMGMRFSLVYCEEEASAITIIFTTLAYDTDDSDFVRFAVVFDNSTTGTVANK